MNAVSNPMSHEQRIDVLSQYVAMAVDVATGGSGDESEYARLRGLLIADQSLRKKLPSFVNRCRSVGQFWNFIKCEFDTYKERRRFLWDGINPLITELETTSGFPSDSSAAAVVGRPDRAFVHEHWTRALERRESDPAGAITAARSLMESVCKAILHEGHVEHDDHSELPKLYFKVAELLNLAPNQHSEQMFKRVLGGCHSVVEGLGAIRSKDGDAHGSSPTWYRPKPRHAQLAVNLAGATATFLIETWEDRQSNGVQSVSNQGREDAANSN